MANLLLQHIDYQLFKNNTETDKKNFFRVYRILKKLYFCSPIQRNGPVAQLNRASDYGSEGYRFESCRGHQIFHNIFYQIK